MARAKWADTQAILEMLSVLNLRIPLPRWLVGHASIRERQTPDGSLHISLAVLHPLLGEIYGYTGTLNRIS